MTRQKPVQRFFQQYTVWHQKSLLQVFGCFSNLVKTGLILHQYSNLFEAQFCFFSLKFCFFSIQSRNSLVSSLRKKYISLEVQPYVNLSEVLQSEMIFQLPTQTVESISKLVNLRCFFFEFTLKIGKIICCWTWEWFIETEKENFVR